MQECAVVTERSAKKAEFNAFVEQVNDRRRIYETSVKQIGDAARQQWMRSFVPEHMEVFEEAHEHVEEKPSNWRIYVE